MLRAAETPVFTEEPHYHPPRERRQFALGTTMNMHNSWVCIRKYVVAQDLLVSLLVSARSCCCDRVESANPARREHRVPGGDFTSPRTGLRYHFCGYLIQVSTGNLVTANPLTIPATDCARTLRIMYATIAP